MAEKKISKEKERREKIKELLKNGGSKKSSSETKRRSWINKEINKAKTKK